MARPTTGPAGDGLLFDRSRLWSRIRGVVLLSWIVLFVAVAQLLRQPGVHGWDGLWQEDGTRFLSGALHIPLWKALATTYNGYLHVVPRLAAATATAVPVRWWAATMNFQAAVLVALLAVHFYARLEVLLPRRWPRLLLAAFFVFGPATATETNVNVTNLHWYLDVAAFAALLPGARRRGGMLVDALVVLFAALCDPLCALWLPLAAYRLWQRSSRWDLMAPALLIVGLALQGLAIVTQSAPQGYTQTEVRQLPAAYALRVGGSFLVGDRFLVRSYQSLGSTLTALLIGAVVTLAVAALWWARGQARLLVALALVASLAWFYLPVLLRGTTFLVAFHSLNGSRYSVLPTLALALALSVAVVSRASRRSRPATLVAGALSAFLIAMMVIGFRVPSSRSAGPGWRTSVREAALLCSGQVPDPASNVRHLPHDEVAVPISPRVPAGRRPPWFVAMPCTRLRG